MRIGIIGAGQVAKTFAGYLLKARHEVLLSNSRGPTSLAKEVQELGTGAEAATVAQAANCSIVALAVPWSKIPDTLRGLPHWNGKIVIDTTNQFLSDGKLEDLHGQVSSEIVARQLPGARVVKALNTLYVERFASGPQAGAGKRITFISGDDMSAKKDVGSLLRSFGFAVIDLGSLHTGGLLQQAGGPIAGMDLIQLGD